MTLTLINDFPFQVRKLLDSLPRRWKTRILLFVDFFLFLVSISTALGFRLGFFGLDLTIVKYSGLIGLLLIIKSVVFFSVGIYRPILRYTGFEFILLVLKAVVLSSTLLIVVTYFFNSLQPPRSVLINDAFLTLLLVVGSRLSIRGLNQNLNFLNLPNKLSEQVVIYGAGAAGSQLAQSITHDRRYRVIGFVDDNPSLHKHFVQGLKVYSPDHLPNIIAQKGLDTILLAMPSIDGKTRQQILQRLQSLSVSVKTIPTINEILSGEVSISKIREVHIADLLGRKQVAPRPELLKMDVMGKSVLVTGAGGSIGSELCRQIAKLQPKTLVLYELNEFSLYQIDMELAENNPKLNHVGCLGSVNDEDYLKNVLRRYQVDTVYHAAAYKHVPLVEANPAQGIFNNVLGTLTAARCAIACHVSKFVLISTDKAVRPTNVMGATKRVAELILQALADQPGNRTCLTMVRFGNVLGSSGSVIPRFREQIAQGKPITVTHPDITRYFMSIPEAASLVIQAGAMAKGGEVFLLDMGEPVRIYDLAKQMISLSGLEPGKDIEIKITGLRPGEKIYEELLINTKNAKETKHPKIFCARESKIPWSNLEQLLKMLFFHAQRNNHQHILLELQQLVPEYTPQVRSNVFVSMEQAIDSDAVHN